MPFHNATRHNGGLVTPFAQSLLDEVNGRAFAAAAGLWFPLAQSGVAVTAPANDTNENTLATITIPAGAMGANGSVRIWTTWTYTNSSNIKTLRVRFSGAAGTQYLSNGPTTTVSFQAMTFIHNRNSESSQIGGVQTGLWGTSTTANVTSSVDTSAATTVVITAQKATGSETVTLERYVAELLYAA